MIKLIIWSSLTCSNNTRHHANECSLQHVNHKHMHTINYNGQTLAAHIIMARPAETNKHQIG